MSRFVRLFALSAVIIAGLLPGQAHAYRVFVGVGFPFFAPLPYYAPPPVYYAPPAYYPAPAYYGPAYGVPPVAYAPAPAYPSAAAVSTRCNAGAYVCPTDVPRPVGGACSCPSTAGRLAGRVG